MSRPPDMNRQVLDEASTWFVAFRSQDLDDQARQDFQDWLKRSPEHIRTYLEIASIYADIPAPEGGRTSPELIARAKASPDINVVALSSGQIAMGSLEEASRRGSRDPLPQAKRSFASRVAAAALLLVFVAVGAWFYVERNTYATGVGEQRAITLADGSIVELNARSRVRIAFQDAQRDVELLEGQALFRVAKDHHRPFVVRAGATSVRAVGTQFDVYRKRKGTTVTVIEGRVAVLSGLAAQVPAVEITTTPAAPEPLIPAPMIEPSAMAREILLAAGEQMTVTSTQAQKAERPNIAAATAWTQHQLVFDATPLHEVLEEFGRYTPRRLIVDSPSLADLKISGQYMSASPDSLLRFLSLQKGVIITEVDGETHIRQE